MNSLTLHSTVAGSTAGSRPERGRPGSTGVMGAQIPAYDRVCGGHLGADRVGANRMHATSLTFGTATGGFWAIQNTKTYHSQRRKRP